MDITIHLGLKRPSAIGLIIFLLVAQFSFFAPSFFGHATPSPTISRTVTPGAIGPCTWFVSMDGTTPVAEAMVGGLSVSPGDNLVGTTGQDPAVFINTNLLAVNTAVCLAPQTFVFASSLTVSVNKVMIVGSGAGSIIKPASGSFDIIATNANDLNIHSLTIDTTNMAGGWAIHVGQTGASTRCHLWNLYLQIGSTTGGIDLDINSSVCFVYGNRIQSSLAPTSSGILVASSVDHHIFQNDIGGFGSGYGITLSGVGDVRVEGNQIYTNFGGINVYISKDVSIYGNNICNNLNDGILVNSDTTGVKSGLAITSNEICNNSKTTPNTLDGIRLIASAGTIDSVAITANSIYDDQASMTQRYGMNLASSNYSNLTVSGNTLGKEASGKTINIAVNSPVTWLIQANSGFNPQPTRSVTAGTSPYTYTNNDGYPEQLDLTTIGGLTNLNCRGVVQTTNFYVGLTTTTLNSAQTCVFTWATTATVFQVNPQ